MALLFVTACSSAPPSTISVPPVTTPVPAPEPTPTEEPAPTAISNITFSTGDLVPAFDPGIFEYELTSLTTLEPFTITVSGQDATIDGTQAVNGVPFTTVASALDDTTVITIAGKSVDGQATSYVVHTAPKLRARYTATSFNAAPGKIFLAPLAPNLPSFLYVLDADGALAFYRSVPQMAYDFKQQIVFGKVRYTYIVLDGTTNAGNVKGAKAWVLDEHMQPMFSTGLLSSSTHPSFGVDVHDFLLIDDDHWIVQSYVPEIVQNVPNVPNAEVFSCVVQEVWKGQVVFDWESTSVPELYAASTDGNAFSTLGYSDYAHMNSIAIDPSNGNIVLSFRHLDEILELDRSNRTIVWTLGGKDDMFGLPSDAKPSHQHYARFIEPGRILAFDNSNATGTTKIREWQIDTQNWSATTTTTTVDAHYSYAMGSVQKLGSKYFIGWGYRGTGQSDMTEIDSITHDKSFELTFQTPYSSYRAQKF